MTKVTVIAFLIAIVLLRAIGVVHLVGHTRDDDITEVDDVSVKDRNSTVF